MISVIVPVYKVEQYLNRCIDSILNQTYTDFELILIDDGSPDNCPTICDEYAKKDSRIIVVHQENKGLSSARNAGLDIAKGDYITFIDSDDLVHPQYLEILFSNIIYMGADIAVGNYKNFSNNANIDFNLVTDVDKKIISGIDALSLYFDPNEIEARYVSSCWKLFKRELFDQTRFPVGKLFEDEYVTYRVMYKAKYIVIIDMPLYFYFVNSNGITQNLNMNKRFDDISARFEQLKFLKSVKLYKLYKHALLKFLRINQWNIIECRKNKKNLNLERYKNFVRQYKYVFKEAKVRRIINFKDNYDYYVLTNPEFVIFYRIKRIVLNFVKGRR